MQKGGKRKAGMVNASELSFKLREPESSKVTDTMIWAKRTGVSDGSCFGYHAPEYRGNLPQSHLYLCGT